MVMVRVVHYSVNPDETIKRFHLIELIRLEGCGCDLFEILTKNSQYYLSRLRH